MILSRLLFAFALPLASPVAAQPRAVPTIVFESGLGDGAGVWDQMIKKLGDAAPVYAYDRPGYGRTPKPRTPRDPCSIATELHDRLRIERITPPYLLVGHSLGGQYAYAFARLFPQETAGLVLVD
ncbi:MAG TPA: alpha/beta fold hydrolase, partial [Sphingomonas sp.]|nr:alpha/beta fold hydrolase [Sphingomonas sp.]